MLKQRLTSSSGGALLEFSIIVPILLFLLMAVTQVGVILTEKSQLTEALRSTARFASSLHIENLEMPSTRSSNIDPCATSELEYFQSQLRQNNLDKRLRHFEMKSSPFSYSGNDLPTYAVEALTLKASIGVTCYMCNKLFGIDNDLFEVRSTVRLPYEPDAQSACSDTFTYP